MHGPTCIFWANLTPFSLQQQAAQVPLAAQTPQQKAAATAPSAAERKPWDAAPEEFGFQSAPPPVATAPPPMAAGALPERKAWDAAPEDFGFQSAPPPVAVAPPASIVERKPWDAAPEDFGFRSFTPNSLPPSATAPVDYSQYYSSQSQEAVAAAGDASRAPALAPAPVPAPALSAAPTLANDPFDSVMTDFGEGAGDFFSKAAAAAEDLS
jgi:hypothetical protein